jgi:nucleotide-binding universal stress UspA family protein
LPAAHLGKRASIALRGAHRIGAEEKGMLSIASILVVVERNEDALPVFTKACTLARHFGARLELFMCDAERGYALRHAYDQAGAAAAAASLVDDARRYLEALRRAVDVPELGITVDASCESPMYQGIVQKVLMTGPDLVVKAIGSGDAARPGPSLNDWHLARTCPVPLLFMGRQPWRPSPRIAASVDPTDDETPGFARQIVDAARRFASGCHGELDLLFGRADAIEVATGDAAAGDAAAGEGLRRLALEFRVPPAQVFTLAGDPPQVLPAFVAAQHYDVVALGALTHRQGIAGLVGTLTDALLQSACCDFLLLKPGTYVRLPGSPARSAATGQERC